ncbi:MAG: hypothetical protein GF401_19470 [Chitinivibrionales bacterium]|nr:hypothetical protein [Chitinivibrionales bacterium]
MNNYIIRGYLLFSLLLAGNSVAQEPLFYDDFSAGHGEWVILSGNPQLSTSGDVLTVTNSENSYAIIKHDTLLHDFTFSISINAKTAPYTNLGVCFCLNDQGQGYYAAINNSQQFSIVVMHTGKLLYAAPNSHIKPADNILTVSKYNGNISIYCNGHFCATVEDTADCSGDIALLVPGSTTAEFDDATITNVPVTTDPIGCFADNFDDGDFTGWYTKTNDIEVSAANNAMQLSTPQTGKGTSVWVDGGFNDASVKSTVSWSSGSTDSLYGVVLGVLTHTRDASGMLNVNYNMLGFLINAERRYAKLSPDGSITSTNVSESSIHGTTDTLEIRMRPNTYHFIVNGTLLDSMAVDGSFQPAFAGYFMGGDLSISCDDFIVAPEDNFQCPVQTPTREVLTISTQHPLPSHERVIYNLLGRKILFDGNKNRSPAPHNKLPQGMYFHLHKDDIAHKPVRIEESR